MSIYSFPVFLPDLGLTKAMPPRIPHGAFRHAAPPGPWPWQDVVEDESPFFLDWDTPPPEEDKSNNLNTTLWKRYPSAFFPNWTSIRLERSGLAALLRPPDPDRNCAVYHTDVSQDGHFSEVGRYAIDLTQGAEKRDELWNWFKVGRLEFDKASHCVEMNGRAINQQHGASESSLSRTYPGT